MKLFIWETPYSVSFGDSTLMVVAETEEQARELAKESTSLHFGTPNINTGKGACPVPKRNADFVLDVPASFHYSWSE